MSTRLPPTRARSSATSSRAAFASGSRIVRYDLEPGDSYHVVSTSPHGYEAVGEEAVKVLWVQTVQDLKIREGRPPPYIRRA